jgi:hypothetical protein
MLTSKIFLDYFKGHYHGIFKYTNSEIILFGMNLRPQRSLITAVLTQNDAFQEIKFLCKAFVPVEGQFCIGAFLDQFLGQ